MSSGVKQKVTVKTNDTPGSVCRRRFTLTTRSS